MLFTGSPSGSAGVHGGRFLKPGDKIHASIEGMGEKDGGFDPLTIAVDDRAALDAWAKHLDVAGVQHSTVLTAIQGWVLVFEDADGRRLRLYTLATHGPEIKPDANSPWLQ